ncbi:YjdF family protein [Ruthenibacterium lactatiformans]|uniref:YjdF family protein n=1 Tax=Ruthenibacterium lactatiformans TaxID=1550024 RepID=UPI00307FF0CF
MEQSIGRLTVFFDPPFWVGVFERIENGKLTASRVTFGAEPKDYEVWDFILKHYHELVFSPAVDARIKKTPDNPKRRQRDAKKQLQNPGIGTKSQQALQMHLEENKAERRQTSREKKEREKQRQFDLKQQKRKKKHRGH